MDLLFILFLVLASVFVIIYLIGKSDKGQTPEIVLLPTEVEHELRGEVKQDLPVLTEVVTVEVTEVKQELPVLTEVVGVKAVQENISADAKVVLVPLATTAPAKKVAKKKMVSSPVSKPAKKKPTKSKAPVKTKGVK